MKLSQHHRSRCIIGALCLSSLGAHAQEDASTRFVTKFDKDGDSKLTGE